MFKDEHRYDVWNQIRQQDLRAFARLLPHSLFQQAAEQARLVHWKRFRLLALDGSSIRLPQ